MPSPAATLDWQAPWYQPWQALGRDVAARWSQGSALAEALDAGALAPVRFVPQAAVPAGMAYETFVHDRQACPVQPGLHDFFNGLVWQAFPRTKGVLNRLHAQAIARDGVGARRGPVRDAATVLDENGALLQAPAPLWEALAARRWRLLFVELRPLWAHARLHLFGHALLEQLAAPRKDLTAHVWAADAPLEVPALTDAWLAARCTADVLATKPFVPLPILGVPGWWAGNENFSFYDDSHVFRPRRAPETTTTTTSAGLAPPP